MRIVAVADTHTYEDDLGEIPSGDVFIHAGDLCRGGRLEELFVVSHWLQRLAHPCKIVIAGNHDWCFAREMYASIQTLGKGIVYLQDTGVTFGGVKFWGSPWQPEFRNWAFNLPRGEALASKWALIPADTQVLITHGPPAGIGDRSGMTERPGCADLLAAAQRIRPRLHLFGHIHQDGGFWQHEETCYANVTCWECQRGPTVIDYDVATGKVAPIVVPPA